jgi:hypothetical protein
MTRALRGIVAGVCVWLLIPAAPAQNVLDAAVQKAVQRGVAALKNGPTLRGQNRYEIGAVALVGIALLECDVPAEDASVQKAATDLRKACPELTHTYSLSLALLFFDRLGDPKDVPLIQAMGARLLAGQNSAGGWSYHCPKPTAAEVQRLMNPTPTPSPAANPTQKPLFPFEKKKPLTLPAEAPGAQPPQPAPAAGDFTGGAGDNSNTQFATMAVWVARRYGLPVDEALGRIEARFRASQNPDGGWGYLPRSKELPAMNSSASMTCAGLLGLAVGHGVGTELRVRDPKAKPGAPRPQADPARDAAVRNGFIALAASLDTPFAGAGRDLQQGHYFLWSLERVAMVYGLNTIGNRDWYAWGATLLVNSQGADGAWHGQYSPCVDTAFALLFLRKSNLARDLTDHLKGRVAELKAGGVGGENVGKLKPGVGTPPRPAATEPAAVKLRDELLRAPAGERAQVLARLRDSKGSEYTEALLGAIPHLDDAGRNQARDALAQRLTRMTAATLRAMLKDEESELRRAAALACGMKDDKEHIGDLVAATDDPEPFVLRAVRASLKSLTGQDFGPAADAGPADRAKAAAAWKQWWARQKQ